MKRLLILGLLIGILLAIYEGSAERADAEHGQVRCGSTGVKACILASSSFVSNVIKPQGEIRWCIDARGQNYPGFRAQVSNVMARWATDLRLSGSREVGYGDSSCNVKHSMRDDHPCGGCGAWIYVSSNPLLIEYNAKQGYVRWDSTIGHETGHGFCLLDEHYDKVNFRSWILTYGFWQHGAPTVMDSGTPFLAAYSPLGIWYLTDYDLARCEETIGRSLQEPPCGPFPPVDHGNGLTSVYDSCTDIVTFNNGYTYSPSNGWWGYRDVGFSPCDAAGLRQLPVLSATMPGLHSVFPWSLNYWVTVPGC